MNVSVFSVFVPKFLIQTFLLTSPMGHSAEVCDTGGGLVQHKLSSFDLARPRGSFVGTGPGSSGACARPPTGKLGCGAGKVMPQFGTL